MEDAPLESIDEERYRKCVRRLARFLYGGNV